MIGGGLTSETPSDPKSLNVILVLHPLYCFSPVRQHSSQVTTAQPYSHKYGRLQFPDGWLKALLCRKNLEGDAALKQHSVHLILTISRTIGWNQADHKGIGLAYQYAYTS